MRITKEEKKLKRKGVEVFKFLLYMFGSALLLECYLIFIIVIVNKETLEKSIKPLVSAPLMFGPTLGYIIYISIKNRKRLKIDVKFRRYLVLKTTRVAMIILISLYNLQFSSRNIANSLFFCYGLH